MAFAFDNEILSVDTGPYIQCQIGAKDFPLLRLPFFCLKIVGRWLKHIMPVYFLKA